MKHMTLDMDQYRQTARAAVAEGQVLLRNEGKALPLKKGTRLAVFGRIQFHYYKSGTGSGGMVNVDKVTGILDALLEEKDISVNENLLGVYREWEKKHPFDEGIGWGNEPWSQEEMELSPKIVKEAAEESDTALVIIGRTAGEDQDNLNHPGSYLLTEKEEAMLATVRKHFDQMIVVLNVGNIIDMSFVDTWKPEAVLYAWQGGMTGGYGTADVLLGRTNPSGKLADTIAYQIEDYPSHANFGNLSEDIYEEDIYVGYRYFETVAKERVRYPFGFGLSFSEFEIETKDFVTEEGGGKEGLVKTEVVVTNKGSYPGKEVVQLYVRQPQGKLGKPLMNLAGFAKTKELQPGESQSLTIAVPFYQLASYDETGVSGYPSSYVMEQGEYSFFVGNSVRETKKAGSFLQKETSCLKKLSKLLAPGQKFRRLKPLESAKGELSMGWEEVPVSEMPASQRRKNNLPGEITPTGNQGIVLADVKEGSASMESFIAQLTDEELSCIIRGEGMGSPKVTPGTAAAFGGISESLKTYGIPCGCCADGPSGMRLDSGMKAFSLPNGTLLACSFNTQLVEELYGFTGIEMVKNKVDALLGPGMNLHRHPLNGRNFEYFSEDPLVTGKMAAAMLKGLHKAKVTGTAKHFCANNQETKRHEINSVVSERALREIYLKGYEIAVKEGTADSIMTTYGAVNGIWTAGSYDLNTAILRDEWGFEGIVMTDWWAKINDEGKEAVTNNFAAMTRAQNDIYMVCADASLNGSDDNTLSSLEEGSLTRGELQRNAMNICRFLMNTHAFERLNGRTVKVEITGESAAKEREEQEVVYYKVKDSLVIDMEKADTGKGKEFVFALDLEHIGGYLVEMTAASDLGELAQLPATLLYQGTPIAAFTFNGTGGQWDKRQKKVIIHNKYAVLRIYFAQNGLKVKKIKFTFDKELNEISDKSLYLQA